MTGRERGLVSEVIAHCHQCGKPADTHTNCKNEGCHLLFIQCSDKKAKNILAVVLSATIFIIRQRENRKNCAKVNRMGVMTLINPASATGF